MIRTTVRLLWLPLVAALLGASLQAPAHAAPTWSIMATASATQIKALDATISSDTTAPAMVTGSQVPNSDSNSTAGVDAAGVLSTGAVETTSDSFETAEGIATRTVSRAAGVNLLDGLITADAIKTTVTTHGNDDGSTSADGGTEFVGLKIIGVTLPSDIPHNYFVKVAGVAAISINYFASTEREGGRATLASGLSVRLLDSIGDLPRGATITVNPALTFMSPPPPPSPGAKLGGFGFGTRILGGAGGTVSVNSGPTAIRHTPSGGSHDETLTNATAAVQVPGVLTTGAVESTSASAKDDTGDGYVTNTNEVAGVNLLGGTVTADAVEVTAHGEVTNGAYSGDMDLTFTNLVVAGTPIDLDVAPNTTINVANLGKVVINQQTRAGQINRIRAIYVVLDTATAGLPAGATIEVAVAATSIQ